MMMMMMMMMAVMVMVMVTMTMMPTMINFIMITAHFSVILFSV
jgi:hypothetical protein